jgi:putative ABC transport system permease protein
MAILRHERLRTVLAVIGVALAVLASVLLVSVGIGVVETGQQQFDQAGRDLWISGGPVEIQPGSVGAFENSLVDAHQLEAQLNARSDVATADPFVFQAVYISQTQSEFDTVIAVGAAATPAAVSVSEGRAIERGDVHYGNGTYNGPMVHEVIIDQRIADRYNVSVGDSLYLGATTSVARQHEFTIVGISDMYSSSVGTATVVMPSSELQEISGLTASDRAALMTVKLADDVDPAATKTELERAYPSYTIRTNQEQLQSTLADQAIVIASGASLVVLAVIAGILLLINLQLSFVARYQETFGALTALGTSQSSLVIVVVCNTLCVGILGGVLGAGLSLPGAWALNRIAFAITGFEGVVAVSNRILLGGVAVSVVISLLGGTAATLYLGRLRPLEHLR